ncbi:MAG: GerMN domain-containing protein [Thermostichales cyanobacterium SZTDM-1c_bins_54]
MKASRLSRGMSWGDVLTVLLGIGLGVGAVSVVWWLISHAPESVQLYWISEQGQLVAEQRSLWVASHEHTLEASLRTLLSGSPKEPWFSAIPPEVVSWGLRVEGGDIFVDVSPQFRADSDGLSRAHALARLHQLVFTATQEFPQGRVWLTVGGQSLETLGDLRIPQPLTRELLQQLAKPQPAPSALSDPTSAATSGSQTD